MLCPLLKLKRTALNDRVRNGRRRPASERANSAVRQVGDAGIRPFSAAPNIRSVVELKVIVSFQLRYSI